MTYFDIGHRSRPQDSELWWWWSANKADHLDRVCPLFTTQRPDYGESTNEVTITTHQYAIPLDEQRRLSQRYGAQGRVDHVKAKVSFIPLTIIPRFVLAHVERLLQRAFPGYALHKL